MAKKGRLFEYAVLWHQTDEEGEVTQSEIVVPVEWVVAKDESAVRIRASRQIPERLLDRLDEVEILVRPF